MCAHLDLSAWLLPHHPSPYGHVSPVLPLSHTRLPPYWRQLQESYETLSTALEVYLRQHPTLARKPGVTLWLCFQRFSNLITDCAFGNPSNPLIKVDSLIDALSLIIHIAQSLTKLDYTQPFNPRRLRDLPNQVVRLIAMINGQLSLLPPGMVQRSVRRADKLVAQMEELLRCRGGHGPLLFPRLWDEVDRLRNMRDRGRTKFRAWCEVVHEHMIL